MILAVSPATPRQPSPTRNPCSTLPRRLWASPSRRLRALPSESSSTSVRTLPAAFPPCLCQLVMPTAPHPPPFFLSLLIDWLYLSHPPPGQTCHPPAPPWMWQLRPRASPPPIDWPSSPRLPPACVTFTTLALSTATSARRPWLCLCRRHVWSRHGACALLLFFFFFFFFSFCMASDRERMFPVHLCLTPSPVLV